MSKLRWYDVVCLSKYIRDGINQITINLEIGINIEEQQNTCKTISNRKKLNYKLIIYWKLII